MKKGQVLCIVEAMKLMNEIEVSIDFVLHLNFLLLCSATAIIAICFFVFLLFFIFYFGCCVLVSNVFLSFYFRVVCLSLED